jgi:hypothetical protein
MDQNKFDRIVNILRANIQYAVVCPWIGDPIDTRIDEEHLYPWIVNIVVRAIENGA